MAENAARQIRLMLVDDESIVRRGLALLVGESPSVRVVAEARDGDEAIDVAGRAQPDVILLDVNLRGENGLDLIGPLLERVGGAKVLVLTGATDSETYLEAMRRGAMGLLLKDKEPEALHRAIRKVHAGEAWFDRALLGRLQQERSRPAPANSAEAARILTLTPRQREVIAALGEGLPNVKIAERLNISYGTVRRHLNDIFNKLGVGDRFELVVFAYRHGLAHPPQ